MLIVLITVVIIFIALSILGYVRKKKIDKQKRVFGNKALDYIASHTYEQMEREMKGKNISQICLQAYIIVKDYAKYCKKENEKQVYKKIREWRLNGQI